MTGSVLRTELRRGAAGLTSVAVAVAGVLLLLTNASGWAGVWVNAAAAGRTALLVLLPLTVAAGAWQAGRDRRRGIGELLASTPRDAGHRHILRWSAVALAAASGQLAVVATTVVLVAPVAGYAGGGWPGIVVVGVLAVVLGTAVGAAFGQRIPGRLVAPLAGVATYVALGAATYAEGRGAVWLSPVIPGFLMEGRRLPTSVSVLQGAVTVLLTAVALLLAVPARRAVRVLVPAAAALLLAAPLVAGPGHARWEPDPAARALVCAAPPGPKVCVAAVHAHLLDQVAPPLRAVLSRLRDVPGAPTRAEDVFGSRAAFAGVLPFNLVGQTTLRGRLRDPAWTILTSLDSLRPMCDPYGPNWEAVDSTAFYAARAWALAPSGVHDPGSPAPDDRAGAAVTRLQTLDPMAQRDWMGRYLRAAADCDVRTLEGLVAEL